MMFSITNYYGNANQNHTELLLTPIWMATVKRTKDKCWSGLEKLEGLYIVGRKNAAAAVENSVALLKKLEIELPYDPAILFLVIYAKESKSRSQRDISPPLFIATLLNFL